MIIFATAICSQSEIRTLSVMKGANFAVTSQKFCLNTELPLESGAPVVMLSKDLNITDSWSL